MALASPLLRISFPTFLASSSRMTLEDESWVEAERGAEGLEKLLTPPARVTEAAVRGNDESRRSMSSGCESEVM